MLFQNECWVGNDGVNGRAKRVVFLGNGLEDGVNLLAVGSSDFPALAVADRFSHDGMEHALFDVALFIQARCASKGIAGSLTAICQFDFKQTRLTRWRFELVFFRVKRQM